MAFDTDLPVDILRSVVDYDPETGEFRWLRRKLEDFATVGAGRAWNTKHAGKIAGCIHKSTGYLRITINNKPVLGHRAAMTLALGSPPKGEIDHINGVRSDNRLVNLRVVTTSQNHRNICLPKRNKSGVLGVNMHQGRWRAFVNVIGLGSIHLGNYGTKEEAAAARRGAEKVLGFHENHGRPPPPQGHG